MSEPVGNGPREPRESRPAIPGNSHKDRQAMPEAAEPREKLARVVQGKAVVARLPWYKRAARNMIADDATTIGDYILIDVLVPAVKNLIFDIITQGTGRALYPGGRAVSGGGIRGGGLGMRGSQSSIKTKYDQMGTGQDPRAIMSREARATHDFKQITIPTREEAVLVMESLMGRVERYGTTTVADLYELCGVTGDFADQRWGWRSLQGAGIQQHRGGWLLDLPDAEPLSRS